MPWQTGAVPPVDTLLAGRYRLREVIGTGASGKVWRARDERLQRDVAVKTVDLDTQHGDPGIVARFRREAQASAGLSSPYIAAVYDAGQDDHFAYIVMEALSGPSLRTLIDERGPLGFADGLPLAADVARGLADAHAAGIVHRDLKPANVVLNQGTAKIVDFGLARLVDPGDATMTSAATIAGTAAYMSPEQARGDRVSEATDLYSLGCLLFALFTGEPPFAKGHPLAEAGAHVHEAPPLLSERRPDAPPPLVVLVDRLLDKDPRRRPDAPTAARELTQLRDEWWLASQPSPAPAARTAVLPAIDLDATEAFPAPLVTEPEPQVSAPVVEASAPVVARRPPRALLWLTTLVLAGAAAAVGWLVYSLVRPAEPTPVPTPIATSTTSQPVPTLTIPVTTPTFSTPTPTPTTSRPTATSAAPSASRPPTTTASTAAPTTTTSAAPTPTTKSPASPAPTPPSTTPVR